MKNEETSCRQCAAPIPEGCTVTCGASACQEKETAATLERAKRRRVRK